VSREEGGLGFQQGKTARKGVSQEGNRGKEKKEDAENSSYALDLPTLYGLREGKCRRGIRNGS
jgi:hypothetical protein